MDSETEYDDGLEYAHPDGDKTQPKISKTAHMKALQMLIADKKERIKKILAKSSS